MKPTEEQAAIFKTLWEQRWSAGDIVRRFDGQFTRSQVLGKIYRMGLMRNKRPKPMTPAAIRETREKRIRQDRPVLRDSQRKVVIRNGRNGKPRVTPAVRSDGMPFASDRPMPTVSETARRSFNEDCGPAYGLASLPPGGCKWPIGDPQDRHFCYCAAPRPLGQPYCPTHSFIARAPLARR